MGTGLVEGTEVFGGCEVRRLLIGLIMAGLAVSLALRSGEAGCRHVQPYYAKQAAVFFTPAYVPQYYSVGLPLQMQAIKEQLKAELRAEQLQAPSQSQACPTPAQPQTLPLTTAPDKWALVRANCAGCHTTKTEAQEAVNMADLDALPCETKLKMAAAVLDGKMPPKKPLDPAVLGNLLGEIVGAETAHQP